MNETQQRGPACRQAGFAPIILLILPVVAGIVGYILILKHGGVEYIVEYVKKQLTWPRPTSTSTPAPGCYYQQVECFTAPCEPILVCPISQAGGAPKD